ncbi:hypothetical protein K469DRAFT_812049 [Zopfia rhizophila CBS 207.26]|uniref:Uncharacterized protein n=1 Tax=Zopfia rhizophila CBS 207.26 TaxID=1314779 RepID=A0A6A6EFL7_9PEZI|nr:hypothetical protein K469DRAFT_812049 [Zopfia rhizophila CBS 207.26]
MVLANSTVHHGDFNNTERVTDVAHIQYLDEFGQVHGQINDMLNEFNGRAVKLIEDYEKKIAALEKDFHNRVGALQEMVAKIGGKQKEVEGAKKASGGLNSLMKSTVKVQTELRGRVEKVEAKVAELEKEKADLARQNKELFSHVMPLKEDLDNQKALNAEGQAAVERLKAIRVNWTSIRDLMDRPLV